MNNLVSLRHLVAEEEMHSSIARIGTMTSLQELHNFRVHSSDGFHISQLQYMNELVELGVFQLEKVASIHEAYGARLRNKQHLEKLHLSWNNASSLVESDNGTSSEHSMNIEREVLEGLEPHLGLKHLKISGYSGMTIPTWLTGNILVTTLQTLHLECFGEVRILPSLERLPFLKKLNLSNMSRVTEVLVPSLVELVLIDMPMLERCVCTSVENLKSTLSILEIKRCPALKVFNLFESCHKVETEQKSWLPCLRKLIIHDCPKLQVLNPLPPSATCSELCISGVSTLPTIQGSSKETINGVSARPDIEELSCKRLFIGVRKFLYSLEQSSYGEFSDKLLTLDHKILAFHNLRLLTFLNIACYPNLASISFKGLSQLASLKTLSIHKCRKLFSSHILPEHTDEDIAAANCNALPSLKFFWISSCGISGKWLSVILQRYAPALEEFIITGCPKITQFSIYSCHRQVTRFCQSDPISAPEAPSSGYLDDTLTSSAPDGLLHIQSNLSSSLKTLYIFGCHITFNGGKEGLSRFTSLEKLRIWESPELLSSLVHQNRGNDHVDLIWLLPQSLAKLCIRRYPRETLRLCFPEDHTCLKTLTVDGTVHGGRGRSCLESLHLQACTTLDVLTIRDCESLAALEGLHSLRNLELDRCPSLPPGLEHLSRQGYEICPRLESLKIDDNSFLTRSFCKQLTSLRRLELLGVESKATRLTVEQERALQHLISLQELEFACYSELVDLPAGLHSLPSLKSLVIRYCPGILSLPAKGLPPSLEQLEIYECSKELTDQCSMLETSKLMVITT